jgi:heat shock protein HtpX
MQSSPTKPCPECGTANRPHARTCRQCGAPLISDWQEKPLLRNKVLRRTDFMAAARANQRATRRLVLVLLLVLVVLGYLLGWSLQAMTGNIPVENETKWFASHWGGWTALVLFFIGAVWSWISFRAGDRIILRLTGANAVTVDEEPQLHNVVEEMAIAAGIRKPRVCVIETDRGDARLAGCAQS